MRRPIHTGIVFIVLALCAGCGETFERGHDVPLEQVPAEVMKAAKARLPNVDFDTAWVEKEGGEDAYEVRGHTKDGKTRDVKVTTSGKILEVD